MIFRAGRQFVFAFHLYRAVVEVVPSADLGDGLGVEVKEGDGVGGAQVVFRNSTSTMLTPSMMLFSSVPRLS